jgi:hypothetical protein
MVSLNSSHEMYVVDNISQRTTTTCEHGLSYLSSPWSYRFPLDGHCNPSWTTQDGVGRSVVLLASRVSLCLWSLHGCGKWYVSQTPGSLQVILHH